MASIHELRDERGRITAEQRAMYEKARAEGRDLNAEEQATDAKLEARFEIATKELEREQRLRERERELAARDIAEQRGADKEGDGKEFRYWKNPDATDKRTSFNRYLIKGPHALSAEEFRALSVGSDTEGGYIVAPQVLARELIKAVDDDTSALTVCKTYPRPRGASLGGPSIDSDPDDADWTTELATGSEDSSMAFGKRALEPHPLAKRIKVSRKLLGVAELNPESIVIERLAYKAAITVEKAFMTGNGNGRALGLFTASNDGITTDRDVSEGNTDTNITGDGLINAVFSLKEGHARNATWIFHRDTVKRIRKLKDGEGQYLWQMGLAGGRPDTILDRPYLMSEYAPNTFTSGQYVGILGDLRRFWWAIALDFQVQRLTELYAEANQVGYIARMELDGMPVLAEAFARVKLG